MRWWTPTAQKSNKSFVANKFLSSLANFGEHFGSAEHSVTYVFFWGMGMYVFFWRCTYTPRKAERGTNRKRHQNVNPKPLIFGVPNVCFFGGLSWWFAFRLDPLMNERDWFHLGASPIRIPNHQRPQATKPYHFVWDGGDIFGICAFWSTLLCGQDWEGATSNLYMCVVSIPISYSV